MIDLFIIHTGNRAPICDQYRRPLLFSSLGDAELFRDYLKAKAIKIYIMRLEKIFLNYKHVNFSLIEFRDGVWCFGIVILKIFDEEGTDENSQSNFVMNVNSPVLLNFSEVTLSDEIVAKKGIGKNFIKRFEL